MSILEILERLYKDKDDDYIVSVGHWVPHENLWVPEEIRIKDDKRFVPDLELRVGEIRKALNPEYPYENTN